jgi:phosphopantothenoylcysteine decarboxylase/phosphopantothenate--cysteine ligase
MADVGEILNAILELLGRKDMLKGKHVLVTAGPTREPIDPVRFISNRSSGKMGYAVAEAAVKLGATVTVVAGPTSVSAPGGVRLIEVETARQMYDAALSEFNSADFVIAAAAVADYRPRLVSSQKLKKGGGFADIPVENTDDILAEFGRIKSTQVLVGFAAETEELEDNARAKLRSKNLDWIVANDVTAAGAGFDVDTNIVEIYDKTGRVLRLPKLSKREVAEQLWSLLLQLPK